MANNKTVFQRLRDVVVGTRTGSLYNNEKSVSVYNIPMDTSTVLYTSNSKEERDQQLSLMKQQKFNIVDQPQLFYLKSQGFRHLERSAKNKKLYYLHSDAYEYCVSNKY